MRLAQPGPDCRSDNDLLGLIGIAQAAYHVPGSKLGDILKHCHAVAVKGQRPGGCVPSGFLAGGRVADHGDTRLPAPLADGVPGRVRGRSFRCIIAGRRGISWNRR
jgi:hypothetical protein